MNLGKIGIFARDLKSLDKLNSEFMIDLDFT